MTRLWDWVWVGARDLTSLSGIWGFESSGWEDIGCRNLRREEIAISRLGIRRYGVEMILPTAATCGVVR